MTVNKDIIEKAAITTSSLTAGLLNPEQSKQFLKQVFDSTPLMDAVRHELRKARTGEIDKIGIARRILRKKTENTDDDYRAGVDTGTVEYATTAVRLPWEISGETLRENIEGENFESVVTDLMSRQVGVDLEDLSINGDEEAAPGDDYDFLKINDGWLKQIENGGHVYDATDAGGMSIEMFYKALGELPNKYNNGKLRWIMSPRRAQEWEMYLLNQVITAGGSVPDSLYESPAKIPALICANMPDDKIVLTDPKNLIVVNTYNMQIRKTNEGKEAVLKDMTYYVIHLDFDPVIEELDATAIITEIGAVTDDTP